MFDLFTLLPFLTRILNFFTYSTPDDYVIVYDSRD